MEFKRMPETIARRELLKIASAALVGLAAAGPGWAFSGQLVQNVAKTANWTPLFFNAHQNDTVMTLAELIIPQTDTPGAKEAKVHRYMDLFLWVKSRADQKEFAEGLAWLDRCAREICQRDFADCSQSEQTKLLNQAIIGHAFFDQFKKMAASIYYATPEGFRELNKFGAAPSTLGCEHAPQQTS